MHTEAIMLTPTVARYMTSNPVTIAPKASMAEAHHVMRQHSIRHLPVVDADRMVGLVSLYDLHLFETFPGVVAEEVAVEDAMTAEVYTASPHDDLADVVEYMADHKLGCVVVASGGRVEGILTAIDALYVLASLLRRDTA
jgi:CBS domain-containing protein